MLKTAILDKESLVVGQIEKMIEHICRKKEIKVDIDIFDKEADFIEKIFNEEKYDIIYVYIGKVKRAIIDTIKVIREKDENVIVIFISKSEDVLTDILPWNAFAFLKVPIDKKLFIESFLKANMRLKSKNVYFIYDYRKETFRIPCNKILYFESRGRQIRVYTCDDSIRVFNGKLCDVESKLKEGKIHFTRIHQSFLVNDSFIQSFLKSEITLSNGVKLPISESKQKALHRELVILMKK